MIRAPWLLVFTTLLVGPALLQAQETYTIKVKIGGKGAVTLVSKEETSDSRSVINANGKEIKQTEEKKVVTKFKEEILEQDADGFPTKVRRVYEKALTTKSDGTAVKQEPYHAKTLLIEKKDGKPSFRIEGGNTLATKAVGPLTKEFTKKLSPAKQMELVLPKKAVSVGETWKLDTPALKALLGADDDDDKITADFTKATVTGKLLKAYKKDGKQFGVIQYDVNLPISKVACLEFKTGAAMTLTMTVDGCIDGASETSIMKGRFNLKGEATGNGFSLALEVTGTAVESREEAK